MPQQFTVCLSLQQLPHMNIFQKEWKYNKYMTWQLCYYAKFWGDFIIEIYC